MDRWELLDGGPVPGTTSTMSLMRRGEELAILVDNRQLMSSRVFGSEEALADLAFDRLGERPQSATLIGGLGMGFTLAAALRRAGPEASVVVAELVPMVRQWGHGPLSHVAGHPLRDPRATVFEGDVADAIRSEPSRWDAILLDVDNGPSGLTRATNDWLYQWQGLEAARRALRPGGILAVWSAAPDDGFTRRVRRAGFDVEVVGVRSRGKKGGHRHTVWVATRAEGRPPAGGPR
jgi:spermidine synthase